MGGGLTRARAQVERNEGDLKQVQTVDEGLGIIRVWPAAADESRPKRRRADDDDDVACQVAGLRQDLAALRVDHDALLARVAALERR